MGSPPEYSAAEEEEADPSDPLLGTSTEYSYPPSHAVNEQDDDAPSVVYYYSPKYPATGDTQRLMGALSRSREDTITTVQSAITSLADVDRSRIHFHNLINPNAPSDEHEWARVLDGVWVKMVQSKPHTLCITLENRPEDIEKINKRNTLICISIGVISGTFGLLALIAVLTSGKDSTKA